MSGDWTPIKKLEGIGLGFIRNGWLLKNKRSNQHVITTLVRQIPNLWVGCRAFFFFPTRRLRWKVHRRPRVRRASVRRRPRRAHTHAKPRAGAFCSCWWQQNYFHLYSSVLLVASNTARDPAWWTETRTQQTPGGVGGSQDTWPPLAHILDSFALFGKICQDRSCGSMSKSPSGTLGKASEIVTLGAEEFRWLLNLAWSAAIDGWLHPCVKAPVEA